MKKKLIAGNWKMNGSLSANVSLLQAVLDGSKGMNCQAAVCVPAAYLAQVQSMLSGQSLIALGSQDVSAQETGAFTGEISAGMLKDFAVRYAIVGHSERRTAHGETDAIVAGQAAAALSAGLKPIICIGETLDQRNSGETLSVIEGQIGGSLAGLPSDPRVVVAYEPLWAIGTGRVAAPGQISEVHDFVRQRLIARFGTAGENVRILYGGSLNPGNAPEILPISNVDGGLIGGASLKAADFLAIYRTAALLSE